MKKICLCLICIILNFTFLTNVFASDLSFEIKEGIDTGQFVVQLVVEENSNICAGSFNIVYDSLSLKIEECEKGTLINAISSFVNPNYSDNAVRVSFASLNPIVDSGTIVELIFSTLNNNVKQTSISIDRASFTDFEGNKLNLSIENGVLNISENIDQAQTEEDSGNSNTSNKNKHTSSGQHSSLIIQQVDASKKDNEEALPTENPTNTETLNDGEKETTKSIQFTDISNHFAENEINYLCDLGIINGYIIEGDYYYKPNQFITREEFIKIICEATNIDIIDNFDTIPFSDWDNVSEWAKKYIYSAFSSQIILGEQISNNTRLCKPRANITRAEAFAIVDRLADFNSSEGKITFADTDDIPDWVCDSLKRLIGAKFVNGYEDNTIRIKNSITRGEAAVIIYKLLSVEETRK